MPEYQESKNKNHYHGFAGNTDTGGGHTHSMNFFTATQKTNVTSGNGYNVICDWGGGIAEWNGNHNHSFSGNTGSSGNGIAKPPTVAFMWVLRYC